MATGDESGSLEPTLGRGGGVRPPSRTGGDGGVPSSSSVRNRSLLRGERRPIVLRTVCRRSGDPSRRRAVSTKAGRSKSCAVGGGAFGKAGRVSNKPSAIGSDGGGRGGGSISLPSATRRFVGSALRNNLDIRFLRSV